MIIGAAQLSLAAWPIRMEYLSGWLVLLLFLALAVPIALLGVRSLAGLGPVRRWVALGVRLAVLLTFVLLIGGIRWQRTHKDLEVVVLRDISESTGLVRDYPQKDKTLQAAIDGYLHGISEESHKPPDDRVGVISFASNATIDEMPGTRLRLDARAIREPGTGTDAASAIQLALASMNRDAMHRLVLIWDGNATAGDLDAALAAAAAQGVQIDVMPLHYDVKNEILADKIIAPNMRRKDEPFTIDVYLRSTNPTSVQGKLSVLDQGRPLDMDPAKPGIQSTRLVMIKPGQNVEHVLVPPSSEGVHFLHAVVDAPNVAVGNGAAGSAEDAEGKAGDTLLANNTADAFTCIQGKGRVLYVNNMKDGGGDRLRQALEQEGINVEEISVDQVPNDLMTFQNYDAVILANVAHGAGGITDDHFLTAYVHEMGGGLVMIGGDESFGAGGWQGSKLEEILPVNMDIPAQREIPKGALVLIMHSCEMPDGNYWGEQCALKAVETLSDRDEIGVISFNNWGGGGGNGSQWDFPLAEKRDGSKVTAAIKNMKLGDMMSFEECMDLALNGGPGGRGLKDSDAKQKHVIIISDGDPSAPSQALYDAYKAAKITVSTVSVYPHGQVVQPQLQQIAQTLKGRAYGPINGNFNQLPQIFIKEATVVRRTLIFEDNKGIPIKQRPSASELVKGLDLSSLPVTGLVLTSAKSSPQIEMPLLAGKNNDPLLAHWQTGLGKSVVFTSDASSKWAATWVGSPLYSKFWSQVVRGVARPGVSSDWEVTTRLDGERLKIHVSAVGKDNQALGFQTIRGHVIGPDGKAREVRLVQTGPGEYDAEMEASQPGNHVVMLNARAPNGEVSLLPPAGVAMTRSPELRELHSNDAILQQIAERTGGRVLDPFDTTTADVFRRDEGLKVTASPLPVWDIVIPILLGLILVDVATRRIAWDWLATKRFAAAAAERVRAWTLSRKVESGQTLDALKRVRGEVAEQKFRPVQEDAQQVAAAIGATQAAAGARPDPKAKFQAKGVEGDISKVVGGATDKPVPAAPKKPEPKGGAAAPGGHTGSLLEAKRRAQQKMKEREQDNG